MRSKCHICNVYFWSRSETICSTCKINKTMKEGLIGRVAKYTWHHTFGSRDYEDLDCYAVGFIFNREKKCGVPSIAKIGEDGRFISFKPKEIKKVDGD